MDEVEKLTKDILTGQKLGPNEARFLVDTYYQVQENRKAAFNQERSLEEQLEPHELISWYARQQQLLEGQLKRALGHYAKNHPVGEWMTSIKGIGPVIAAGLLAHIDIRKAPTVGHIWNFAGLNPEIQWNKGERRPFNAALKTLCWKIGESFVKVSSRDSFYGEIYKQRKEQEIERNEKGEFEQQAKDKLENFKIGKTTDAYKAYSKGKLPPAHIQARSKRYAVKLFLAHLHEIWFIHEYGKNPPNPYPIAILGHAHKIEPPEPEE